MSVKALDVPPYRIQPLIASINDGPAVVSCAQALGSEVYVGCSNGELLRYALQAEDLTKPESYSLLSRRNLPSDKPIEEIVLVPCISRALILSDHQIYFYALPSLDPVSPHIKPIRNVITFAVDYQHLQRPAPSYSDPPTKVDPIEFSVIKRNTIALFSLRERLFFQKEIPLPQGATLAQRIGGYMCVADKEYYNIVDLQEVSAFPLLPLSQAYENTQPVKPFIAVVEGVDFLVVSFQESGTLGVFINGNGEPVRGTLQWPSHPEAICLDYPYIATLLANGTLEIHSIETQEIVQVLPAPTCPEGAMGARFSLAASLSGYMVPSAERTNKMRLKSVPLLRKKPEPLPSIDSTQEERPVVEEEITEENI